MMRYPLLYLYIVYCHLFLSATGIIINTISQLPSSSATRLHHPIYLPSAHPFCPTSLPTSPLPSSPLYHISAVRCLYCTKYFPWLHVQFNRPGIFFRCYNTPRQDTTTFHRNPVYQYRRAEWFMSYLHYPTSITTSVVILPLLRISTHLHSLIMFSPFTTVSIHCTMYL